MFKNKKVVKILAVIFLMQSCIGYAQLKEDVYDKINRNMEIFGDVYKEILLNYVDKINADKFFESGINGMLGTLDPYTVYYGENDHESLDLITAGKYGGIGITISFRDSSIVITDLMNGYEAERKGLRRGDIIKKIDGVDLTGIPNETVRKKVRGQVGTKLSMTVERDNEVLEFELVRQEIILKDISYFGFLKNEEKNIAYIKLDRFGNNSDREFDNVLKTLKSQKEINGLIIDLRNNGGGFLNSSIDILNKLVEKNNLLLTTKANKKDSEVKYFSKENPLIGKDVPLVVLVNQGTASASEIMAGALQDLDRAVIVGVKSFGKGLVQNIKDLNFDTHLKITIARYFTPSGRWIQSKDYFLENKYGVFSNTETFAKKEFKTLNGRLVYANGGITPDVEVKTDGESELHKALIGKDMFFKYALAYVAKNQGIKIFKATDETYTDFRQFLKEKGFDYKSISEKKLDELRKSLTDNKLDEKLTSYLGTIEQTINSEEENEYIRAKDEIKRSIESDINRMIVEEKEQIEGTFDSDMPLQEAISIILDKARYSNILGIQ
ncbi:MAG: S41 family peptidase [Ignavibacteria bacterium]